MVMAEDMRINCARTLDHCYSLETCEHMCEAARWVEFLLKLDVIHELQFPTSSLADTQTNAIDIIHVHQYHVMLGVNLKECSITAALKAYDGSPP
jgi:hypothetical protein